MTDHLGTSDSIGVQIIKSTEGTCPKCQGKTKKHLHGNNYTCSACNIIVIYDGTIVAVE